MVTIDGEVIDTGGMVSGGKGTGEGLLKQKRVLRRLTEEIESLGAEIASLEKAQAKGAQAVATLSAETLWLSELIKTAEIEEATRSHEVETLRAEADRIAERLGTLRAEAEMEQGEMAKLSSEMTETAEVADRLQREQVESERALLALQGEIDATQSGLKSLSEEITSRRVVVASEKQQKEHLLQTEERLRREQIERSTREEERRGQSLALSEKRVGAAAEMDAARSEVIRLAAEREEIVLTLRRESETQAELQQKLQGIESQARDRRQVIEKIQQEAGRVQLSRTNLSLRLAQMEENIRSQYREDLAGMASSEAAPNADLPPEEIRAMKEQAETLRQQISEVGPVNIGAIEEYKELEDRSRFLSAQEADLTRSIDDLHEAIGKINKTTKNLFVETFKNLNARLAEVFASFFGGGKAEMVLLEEGNPLESGVEILVQPPGKRLRNVSLLSGGEKALTAISILFASFLIHPGPFCLLDELDAPLDEENTRRFAQAVRKMSEKIQFIVVTHNKRTMEIADLLHGVTMEESGISKMVSVRLGEAVGSNGHPVEEVLQEQR
jgi:chromosome segregation protein